MSAFSIKNLFLSLKERAEGSDAIAEIQQDSDSDPQIRRTSNGLSPLEDEELAAVITAAIMAAMGSDIKCGIVIKSIKRTGQTSPLWNRAGRLERISGKL